MDPFALLGIERRFDVDLRAVERAHRHLSRVVHPDRQGSEPPGARAEALGRTASLNEAMRIVRDPLRRAETLLSLAGAARDGEGPMEQSFLASMLELREALEDAKDARNLSRVRALAETVLARAEATKAELTQAFRGADEKPAMLEVARARLAELRFFMRFAEEASLAEDVLSEGGGAPLEG